MEFLNLTKFNTMKCIESDNIFQECKNLSLILNKKQNSNIIDNIPNYVKVSFIDDIN